MTAIVKMSGAGNDFVVLGPEEAAGIPDLPGWTRRVCRRGLSVGADGVLLVAPAGPSRVRVTFLNPDGSEAFCGNGTRCAARFARLRGWAGETMVLETASGDVEARVGDRVRIVLPPPVDHGEVPVEEFRGRFVTAGVPHYVVAVPDAAAAPLAAWGPRLRRHPRFGAPGTNVDLVGPAGPGGEIPVRTWERGVEGETLACGSGAVAAAFAARLAGGPERQVVVPASGIPLAVELPGPPGAPRSAVLEGDARVVFTGELACP